MVNGNEEVVRGIAMAINMVLQNRIIYDVSKQLNKSCEEIIKAADSGDGWTDLL